MDDAEKKKIRAAFAYMGSVTQAGLTLEALALGAGILIRDLRAGNAAQADSLREALLQNEEMKKAVEKLSRAPTWHLSAENCDRKTLEDFMERYCLWYNDVTKTEKRKDEDLRRGCVDFGHKGHTVAGRCSNCNERVN